MSDAVSIKYNADVGRHGIAEQKINPGISFDAQCSFDSLVIQNEKDGRVIHDDSVILIPSPGEVVLIEEPLSWTVNVKSFPTACQVRGNT